MGFKQTFQNEYHKTCIKCSEIKPRADFKPYGTKGRVRALCNECMSKMPEKYQNYGSKTPEHLLDKLRAYQVAKPEKKRRDAAKYSKSINGRATIIWHKARNRHNGSENTLVSIERIRKALLLGRCERSGVKFDMEPHPRHYKNPFGPSVDKIDPFGDYTETNTQVVCNTYNSGKGQMTDAEFIAFCREVARRNPEPVT